MAATQKIKLNIPSAIRLASDPQNVSFGVLPINFLKRKAISKNINWAINDIFIATTYLGSPNSKYENKNEEINNRLILKVKKPSFYLITILFCIERLLKRSYPKKQKQTSLIKWFINSIKRSKTVSHPESNWYKWPYYRYKCWASNNSSSC